MLRYSAKIGTNACENAPSAKKPAQDVRQAERRLERVHLHPGAECRGFEAFASEARDPGQQRHAADGRKRAQQVQCEACGGERAEDAGRCAVSGKLLLCLVFFGYSRSATRTATQINLSTRGFRLMANSAQARKRARQAAQTNKHNASLRSSLRTAVKAVRKAIAGGDKAAAAEKLKASQAVIDRIADKKIVHKNWRRGRSRASPTPSRRWRDQREID
jgi:small subunit ribosomal protein S20